jgi:hypothetical protein
VLLLLLLPLLWRMLLLLLLLVLLLLLLLLLLALLAPPLPLFPLLALRGGAGRHRRCWVGAARPPPLLLLLLHAVLAPPRKVGRGHKRRERWQPCSEVAPPLLVAWEAGLAQRLGGLGEHVAQRERVQLAAVAVVAVVAVAAASAAPIAVIIAAAATAVVFIFLGFAAHTTIRIGLVYNLWPHTQTATADHKGKVTTMFCCVF